MQCFKQFQTRKIKTLLDMLKNYPDATPKIVELTGKLKNTIFRELKKYQTNKCLRQYESQKKGH
jgi:hypothetical protein